MRRPRPWDGVRACIGQLITKLKPPPAARFLKLQLPIQHQRQRKTLRPAALLRSFLAPWCSLFPASCLCSTPLARDRRGQEFTPRPRAVETAQAATEGRHSSQPLASPCIKTHGLSAGRIGASGACRNSRPSMRMEAIFPPNAGRTVTEQSPAWMRTFSFSAPVKSVSSLIHPLAISGLRCRPPMYSSQMRPSQLHALVSSAPTEGKSPFRSPACGRPSGRNQRCGNCTSARCKFRPAHASKICCARSERLPAVAAVSFQTTMSSSGGRPRGPRNGRRHPAEPAVQLRARRPPACQPGANSPRVREATDSGLPTAPPPPPRPGSTPG